MERKITDWTVKPKALHYAEWLAHSLNNGCSEFVEGFLTEMSDAGQNATILVQLKLAWHYVLLTEHIPHVWAYCTGHC